MVKLEYMKKEKQNYYGALMLIGLVLIVMTSYLGTSNLQRLMLEQIKTETNLVHIKQYISNLAEDRDEIMNNGQSEEALKQVNQELVSLRIMLLGEVKKWQYIERRTASYIQGGISLLMFGLLIIVFAMYRWNRIIR